MHEEQVFRSFIKTYNKMIRDSKAIASLKTTLMLHDRNNKKIHAVVVKDTPPKIFNAGIVIEVYVPDRDQYIDVTVFDHELDKGDYARSLSDEVVKRESKISREHKRMLSKKKRQEKLEELKYLRSMDKFKE